MTIDRRIRIGDNHNSWLVPYDDAKKPVTIKRTIVDVLTATPGSDTECMNSKCIKAQRNEKAFPHPVYLVSTIKSRVYIVDKLSDDGQPAHAIRYQLSDRDSRLIGTHDSDGAGIDGDLTLRVPKTPKGVSHKQWPVDTDQYPRQNAGGGVKRKVTGRGASARYMVAVGALQDS